jgi:hypothetical protein
MKMGKHLPFLFFVTATVFISPALAQQSNLCVGAYYSEEEGARKLNEVLKSIHSLKDWQAHADSVRRQIRTGMQMDKFPAKTPLNPRSRHKKILDGYSVEAIVFESLPGFFVTGNLYKPIGYFKNKSLAVIASPHGHWNKLEDYGRFRSETQQRCAAFAKMGAIAFSYDMVGYGESQQLDHHYEKVVIFQTWNTLRIIDFLLSFPEADPDRVAVTGESGGGTQTFLATALDDRIKVSVPVVMVSAHFFGGCSCESGMPIHRSGNNVFSNVEIACLAAPRPMLLVSDGDDWTKNTPTVEFPFAKEIYRLYGKESLVENAHFANEVHDYGKNKRLAVYEFLAKHLGLKIANIKGANGKVSEDFITIVDRKDLEYFRPEELAGLAKGEQVYNVLLKSQK